MQDSIMLAIYSFLLCQYCCYGICNVLSLMYFFSYSTAAKHIGSEGKGAVGGRRQKKGSWGHAFTGPFPYIFVSIKTYTIPTLQPYGEY
jgi:hypothetical protein